MKNRIPNSPFSTAISGSEKETVLRVRNIAQGRWKRLSLVLLILLVLAAVLCGSLVACQPGAKDAEGQEGLVNEPPVWEPSDPEVALFFEGLNYPISFGGEVEQLVLALDDRSRGSYERMKMDGYFRYSYAAEDVGIRVFTGHTVGEEKETWTTQISCQAPRYATPRGIHQGSTLEELLAAYPDLRSANDWGDFRNDTDEYYWYNTGLDDQSPLLFFTVDTTEDNPEKTVRVILLLEKRWD